MPNNKLPQRDPFTGPPVGNWAAPADLVELFANALNEWKTTESPHTRSPNSTHPPARARTRPTERSSDGSLDFGDTPASRCHYYRRVCDLPARIDPPHLGRIIMRADYVWALITPASLGQAVKTRMHQQGSDTGPILSHPRSVVGRSSSAPTSPMTWPCSPRCSGSTSRWSGPEARSRYRARPETVSSSVAGSNRPLHVPTVRADGGRRDPRLRRQPRSSSVLVCVG